MSKVQTVRGLIIQRLSAAAEEIFELFERTIAEYEEQLCRSKEENQRQQKLLEAVYNPDAESNQTDPQQLLVRKEVPPERQEWTPSLSQVDPPEPAHIKEEQEEQWRGQGMVHLQKLEEEDIIQFTFTPVTNCQVGDPGEKPESSQLHENQSEENRQYLVKEAEGSTESENNIKSEIHEEGSPSQSGLNSLQNDEPGGKAFSCRVCGKRYHQKRSLANHMRLHSEGHFFSCSFCEKTFPWKRDLLNHMRVHTGEKPFSCSFCGTRFAQRSHLTLHLRVHTGEKPYTCSVCNTSFSVRRTLSDHMTIHTGEKPHNCTACGKRFSQRGALRRHMAIHTGVKRFYCSVCERQFARLEHVKKHKCAGESSRKL
ncbi:uncharacterized protein LOC141802549 [Halichoeres trimaculatus]|uniref:uncharacterized protein LOC141802549 n=1 Tax=Halichoeres trimaculatus TaxID=147232 RepID=UPI003D9DC6B6